MSRQQRSRPEDTAMPGPSSPPLDEVQSRYVWLISQPSAIPVPWCYCYAVTVYPSHGNAPHTSINPTGHCPQELGTLQAWSECSVTIRALCRALQSEELLGAFRTAISSYPQTNPKRQWNVMIFLSTVQLGRLRSIEITWLGQRMRTAQEQNLERAQGPLHGSTSQISPQKRTPQAKDVL